VRHGDDCRLDYGPPRIEQAGHPVPVEERSNLRYMIRATIDLPKQWGPLKGLPRKPGPLLRLLDETTMPRTTQVGTLTLKRIETLETPVVLIYAEQSAFSTPTNTCARTCRVEACCSRKPSGVSFGAARTARGGDPAIVERLLGETPLPGGATDPRAQPRPAGRAGDAVLVTGASTGLGRHGTGAADAGFRVFASVRAEESRQLVAQAAAARVSRSRPCGWTSTIAPASRLPWPT